MNNKPYVFISYAHLDNDLVLPCIDAMKRNGINIWYDEGIEAGSEWPEFIAEKVLNCTKFVLFVSKAYLNSQNCKREFNFAISRKKEILSIILDDVKLTPGMEMQLGTYQAIHRNRFKNTEMFYNSICSESYFNECRLNESENTHQQEQPRTVGNSFTYHKPTQSRATSLSKRRIIAALLAIFLGVFGIHRFYLKQYWLGVIYLLFSSTGITFFVGIIEGIIMLCYTDEKFEEKYERKTNDKTAR